MYLIIRCPTYNNLESSRCYMVRVDGKCCSEPRCTLANGQVVDPTKVQTSFPIVPSLSGGYVNFRPDTDYSAIGSGGYANTSGSRNGIKLLFPGNVYILNTWCKSHCVLLQISY